MVIPGYPSSLKAASTTGSRSSRTIASTFFIKTPPASDIVQSGLRAPPRTPRLSRSRLGPGRGNWRRGDRFDELRRDSTGELRLRHEAPVARLTKLGHGGPGHCSLR